MKAQEICNRLWDIESGERNPTQEGIQEARKLIERVQSIDLGIFNTHEIINEIQNYKLRDAIGQIKTPQEQRSIRGILASSGNKKKKKMEERKALIDELRIAIMYLEQSIEQVSTDMRFIKDKLLQAADNVAGLDYIEGITEIGEETINRIKTSESTRAQIEALLWDLLNEVPI